jgi:hypothetical protein
MGAALPDCVIEFWNPPPARACASAVAITSATAIAASAISHLWRNMTFSSRPNWPVEQ